MLQCFHILRTLTIGSICIFITVRVNILDDMFSGTSHNTKTWTCEKHIGCEVMRFCTDCQLPLCATCLVDIIENGTKSHFNHTINDVKKAKDAYSKVNNKIKKHLHHVRFDCIPF